MKIYKEETKQKKSWAIKLEESSVRSVGAELNAVDINSGKHLTTLIVFYNDGSIVTPDHAKGYLVKGGYDPYEHNNTFSDNGAIVVNFKP
jgi:hypothetical protein